MIYDDLCLRPQHPQNAVHMSGFSHVDHGDDDWHRWYLLLVAKLSSSTTGAGCGAKVVGRLRGKGGGGMMKRDI